MIEGLDPFENRIFEAEMKMRMMIVNNRPITTLLYFPPGYSRPHLRAWPSSAGYARKVFWARITNHQSMKHVYLDHMV